MQLKLLHGAHHGLSLGIGIVIKVPKPMRLPIVHVIINGIDGRATVLDVIMRGTVELGRIGDRRYDRVELLAVLGQEAGSRLAADAHYELAVVHAGLRAGLGAGDAALGADEPRDDAAVVAGQPRVVVDYFFFDNAVFW